MDNSKDDFLVNSILMMGKFYIHKLKYLKVKPTFCAFHNEFVLYTKALKVMKGKNAINLFSIIITGKFLLFCFVLFVCLSSLSLCCISMHLFYIL